MHLHKHGKTWGLFIGWSDELDCWKFEWSWGGKSSERAPNGLYWYRNQIHFTMRNWKVRRKIRFFQPIGNLEYPDFPSTLAVKDIQQQLRTIEQMPPSMRDEYVKAIQKAIDGALAA